MVSDNESVTNAILQGTLLYAPSGGIEKNLMIHCCSQYISKCRLTYYVSFKAARKQKSQYVCCLMRCLFLYSTGGKAHSHSHKQMSLNPTKGITSLCIMLHNSYFIIILKFTKKPGILQENFNEFRK